MLQCWNCLFLFFSREFCEFYYIRKQAMIDEREKLKAKVRDLEREIVERTRNFMSHSSHHKRYKPIRMDSIGVQTGPQLLFFYTDHSEIKCKCFKHKKGSSYSALAQFESIDFTNGTQNPTQNGEWDLNLSCDSEQSASKNQTKKCQQIMQTQKLVLQVEMLKKENSHIHENMRNLQSMLSFLSHKLIQSEMGKSESLRQLTQILDQAALIQKQLELLQEENQMLRIHASPGNWGRQELEKWRIIKKGNELQLLQLQQSAQTQEDEDEKMMAKIQKLSLLNKQYIKSYSRLKDKNCELQDKIKLLQEQLKQQLKEQCKGQCKQQCKEKRGRKHKKSRERELATIQQQREDEIQDILRQSSGQCSFSLIISFLEKSLEERNRLSAEKWIASSILKLRQMEQREKLISNKEIPAHQTAIKI